MRVRLLSSRLFVLLLLAFAPAAQAAKPVTVTELEQILQADRGQSDRHVAGLLAGLTLTERLSSARLEQSESAFPGRRAQAALLLLADESAFLSLPAADISSEPPPSQAFQEQIFGRVFEYARRAVHELPNFLATRTTLHFEDSLPQVMEQARNAASSGGISALGVPSLSTEAVNYLSLHQAGKSSVSVAYRDGEEIDTARGGEHDLGLTTRGEFGPVLAVVLNDAAHSLVGWGYWQQTLTGHRAVFRYEVSPEKSHYQVGFHTGKDPVRSYPAYHGEIAVDPDTGSILRLSVISELAPPFQMIGTGILVEYGPVVIGDRTYICPLHGVALSKIPVLDSGTLPTQPMPIQTRLNDVAFTNYHLFRAEARILSPEESQHLPESPH